MENITPETFNESLAKVMTGNFSFFVSTHYKQTKIDKKTFDRFAKVQRVPIKISRDGRGFWLARGMNWDFVYPEYLFLSEA